MRDHVRIGLAALCYYSGLIKLVRFWTQCAGPRLIILNYHRAAGNTLRQHLRYLRRHYRMLHLETALEELSSKAASQRDRSTLLAVTFDDGYYDNYSHAFAIAEELKVPITIFLVPGYIENGHHFWWLEGQRIVQCAQVREALIEGKIYHLDHEEERLALLQMIEARLLNATSVAQREEFLNVLHDTLQVPETLTAEERLALPLAWQEVQAMGQSDWISFGAHTMHHPVLAYLEDAAELRFEVEECRKVLEQRLERTIRAFAYPLGKAEHIGDVAPCAVRQAGYRWAVTTLPGVNTAQTDAYMLRRRNVGVNQHWLLVAAETAGVWCFLSQLARRSLAFMRGRRK
ncbi:MAG TPA: polysaccharide deacetylase family protein [Ktedonobacteraceae bacterium]|nr:polysaccharide deacetylase family protein [Ktedonobacteraceae bacterium]